MLRDKNTDTDNLCDDQRLYYQTDVNYNVTALIEGLSGDADLGEAVERYKYDAYGCVTVLEGEADADGAVTEWDDDDDSPNDSDWDNSVLFAGYQRDGKTRLYSVRYRIYNPSLGRWMQRDPLGYIDGSNLYEYVGGNPVTSLDAYGLYDYVDCSTLTPPNCTSSKYCKLGENKAGKCKEMYGGKDGKYVNYCACRELELGPLSDSTAGKTCGNSASASSGSLMGISHQPGCTACPDPPGDVTHTDHSHNGQCPHTHTFEYHQAPAPDCICRLVKSTPGTASAEVVP